MEMQNLVSGGSAFFIEDFLRSQLSDHANDVNRIITDKSFVLGVAYYTREELEGVVKTGEIKYVYCKSKCLVQNKS